jgi:hypothetical protein
MANYNAYSRTNTFRVTDKEKLKEIIEQNPDIQIWEEEGKFILSGYCIITDFYNGETDEFYEIFPLIQPLLPDGEVVIFTEVGHEKLRYLVAASVVITNKEIYLVDLQQEVIKLIKNKFDITIENLWD